MSRYEVIQGTSKDITWRLKDDYGQPLNISSYDSAKFKVFLEITGDNDSPVIDKTASIDDATEGVVSITINDSESDITPAVYTYYLELVKSSDTYVMDKGSVEIIGDDTDTVDKVKRKYGLNYSYNVLRDAVNYAQDRLLQDTLLREEVDYAHTDANNNIEIPNYVCDSNHDGVVDEDDIIVKEYQNNSPYSINDLSSNIVSVTFDHPNGKTIIHMDDKYPTNGYTMFVEYYRISKKYSDALSVLDRIRDYYIFIYLFENLSVYKLQQGLSSKSINGVNIDFDKQSVDDMLNSFYRKIRFEKVNISPLEKSDDSGNGFYNIRIRKGY